MSLYRMVREFHSAFGLPVRTEPSAEPVGRAERTLRHRLHREELGELEDAMGQGDVVEAADALADLCYVLAGTALHYGIDLDTVIAEVHRSNMTKLENGQPVTDPGGKVIKGKGFERPNLRAVLGL